MKRNFKFISQLQYVFFYYLKKHKKQDPVMARL